jgi:hypothetical protein
LRAEKLKRRKVEHDMVEAAQQTAANMHEVFAEQIGLLLHETNKQMQKKTREIAKEYKGDAAG